MSDSLYSDLPTTEDLSDALAPARDTLRLAVAYSVAHRRLALADVVVRAAEAFTGAEDAETSSIALENLFDAVARHRAALLKDAQGDSDALGVARGK
jgi:hypothetical protein